MKTINGILSLLLILAVGLAMGFACGYCHWDSKATSGQLMRVTAFCPCKKCCGKWADGITASGHVIQKDDKFVAAPPNIPFGTLLVVPGYADGLPVPVLDRGGAIKGRRIDVYFDTHQKALNWGVKWLRIRR